jgi:hypothetical protein
MGSLMSTKELNAGCWVELVPWRGWAWGVCRDPGLIIVLLAAEVPWPRVLALCRPNRVLMGVKLVVKVVLGCLCQWLLEGPSAANAS